MSARLRIGYLQHGLSYGGAPVSLFLLQKSLADRPIDKFLLTPSVASETLREMFLKHNQKIVPCGESQLHNNQVTRTRILSFAMRRLIGGRRCPRIVNRLELDILHVNSTVFAHLYQQLKQQTNVKIVTHVRELLPKYGRGAIQRFIVGRILRYSDAIIAISDNEAQPFLGHSNLHVIANPFDFEAIAGCSEQRFRQTHSIPDHAVVVTMLGQFHRSKGHLDFLEALHVLLERGIEPGTIVFVVVGVTPAPAPWKRIVKKILQRDDYHRAVDACIRRHRLERSVRLVPVTSDVFGILRATDIVVRPSLSGDPWGRDVIEAMAFGKPVVATGTSQFFVQDGVTGFLVSPGRPVELAGRIQELIRDQAMRKTFGARGFARVREMSDLTSYGNRISQVYASVMPPEITAGGAMDRSTRCGEPRA